VLPASLDAGIVFRYVCARGGQYETPGWGVLSRLGLERFLEIRIVDRHVEDVEVV
jgi:hypothetical protein